MSDRSTLPAAAIVLILGLAGWQPAFSAACPQQIDANDCVANDLQPSGLEIVNAPAACTEGEIISVTARVLFENGGGAAERYNVGFFVGDDGDSVIGGASCTFDSLQPVGPPLDLTSGSGGFRELNGDACGDIARREPTYKDVTSDRILCQDENGDGRLDVSYVLTWVNNGNQASCQDPLDPLEFAPNPPKCLSDLELDLPITVEPPPSIDVQKFAYPSSLPAPGGLVRYGFTVTNTSAADSDPVIIDSIVDVPLGDLTDITSCVLPFVVDPGDSFTCYFITEVTGAPGDRIPNTVTIRGADDEGSPVQDSDDAEVVILDPAQPPPPGELRLTKIASPARVPEPGGTVRYTVGVLNPSPTAVRLDSLVDDLYGDLNGRGSCSVPQTLVGASALYLCSFEETVGGQPGDVITDVVTATGVDESSPPLALVAEDDASVTIEDVGSDIEVIKIASPDTVTEPGGAVNFTLRVQNVSVTDTVTITSLLDNLLGVPRGNCITPFTLAPGGGAFECSYPGLVTGNAGDTVTNVVLASGTDDDGGRVSDTAAATVFVTGAPPTIAVSKVAVPSLVPESGGEVTYFVTVQNTSAGSDPVLLTSLGDEVNGTVMNLDGVGDCDLDLAGGGIVLPPAPDPASLYSCSFTVTGVTGTAGQPLVDTVTAEAVDDDGATVTAAAQASVDFVAEPPLLPDPDLRLFKFASPRELPEPGGVTTYTVLLVNAVDSDDPQDTLTVDSLVDDIYGDLDGKGTCGLPVDIPPRGVASCRFDERVNGNAGRVVTDVITAGAVNGRGQRVSAVDDATVTIVDVLPTIRAVKQASPTSAPEPGAEVEFLVEVYNTSRGDAVVLESLVDNIHGDLLAQGLCPPPSRLFPDREPYRCSFTAFVGGEPGDEERNTVVAVASDEEGNAAEDQAQAAVAILDVPARLNMTKTAFPRGLAAPGGDVRFTFAVSNDSKTDTITLERLEDTVFGDLDGAGSCRLPQVLPPQGVYTCESVQALSGEARDVHYNEARVSGTSDDGERLSASAAAVVTFLGIGGERPGAAREVPAATTLGLAALALLMAWLGLLSVRGRA